MADFSFDDFLGSQEPERGNANSSAESGFSFDDFLASDEEPSASSLDVQAGLEQPAPSAPQYGPGSEMEKYKQEQARIRRTADWYNRGIIGEGRKHLGTREDGSEAFEYDAEHAPAFAPQDDEGKAIHERVKAFEGGNLGHFDRPMKIEYDEDTGKAKGYGTTKSTIVEEVDGTWSVIPTIWRDERDGKPVEAVDEQDAREHYRENGGQRFGNFKTREEAIAAAKDIHELHQRAYGAKWNQWINEHWDEVDDSVKNADGVREAHEAWERAGRPGIRFTMKVDGEEGGDGAAGDLPEGEQGKPMGILEHGAKSLQAATGREYGEGMAALLNIAPFGRQSESFDANRHVAALERARSGDYEDKDIEEVAKSLGPGYWEEVRPIYAVSKDDARKFLSGMAESELREITRNKKGAALDMEARPLSGWGKAVASTVENSGYVNSFIYGSVLIPVSGPAGSFWSAAASGGVKPGLKWIGQSALKSAAGSIPASVAGGMERASDLANKTYEIGENAELRVIDNNYSTLVSALKGGAGSVVENMVVEGLTDEAINIGLLGAAKLFLRYPGTLDMLKGASRGLIRSGAGRALIRLGQGYNALSQFTQFDSIPNEQFEEILQPIFDDVVGLGKRKGEKTDTFGEYAGKMFTSKNQTDIFIGLVGTMLLQGGAAGAHAASRRFSKEGRMEIEDARRARSILIEAKADPKMVNALTDEEAMSTAEAYRAMLQNPKIAEDIANALDDRRGEIFSQLTAAQESKMNGDLADLGITPKEFTIPIKEGANGAVPDFKEQLVVNPTTGESFQGRMVVDAESGVRIVDNGAGNQENAYTVFDPMTGKSLGVDNLYMAKRAADFLVANQQLYKAQDEIKLDFINDEWTKNYGDAKVFAARTIDEAMEFSKQHGVDVTRQNGFSPTRRGWRLEDGTVVLVRDNIKTPLEARQLMRHENIGHSDALSGAQWLDAGGTIGELRERNMKKVDASNPAERLRAAKESVANIVQRRMHNPTTGEKLSHAIRNGLRKLGYNLNMNDADLEVEAAKVEKAMREGKGGSIDLAPILRTAVDVYAPEAPTSDSAEPTETIETGEPNETGNRTDEAQSQPEQGEAAKPAAGEAEESVEAESPRAEAPAAGVVEPEKRGESAATAKPVSERNIVEKLTDQAPVQELPVAEVVNDDSRIPNFKEGANPETGEVEPLTGEPYDLVSNPIVVMEFKDGKKVVVTGRHRLALYKRSGRKTIAARVIREADGWTVDDAKAIDAIGNIIDEKGTVKDYVNYFNNAKPTREEAKAGGFLDRPKGQRAFGIFEGATEATKSVIDWNGTGGDGLISADQAGIIAEAAPKGENKRFGAVQRILVQKALAGLRGKKLGILARSLAEEAKTRKDTPNVGGEMQLDLFTSEDDQKLLALEEKRSDYRVKKSEEYGRVAEVLRTALAKGGKLDLNADYAKELGITDPNDKKQLAAARDKAVERANYWENAVTLDAADKEAMDAEINAKADTKAKRLAEVKAKVEAIKAKREGKAAVSKTETTTPASEGRVPIIDATTDTRKILDANAVTANGERDEYPLSDKVYYDEKHKFAWKMMRGVGRNQGKAYYHIYEPAVLRVAGNKRFGWREYVLSDDGTTMKQVDFKDFLTKEEAQSAFDKFIGRTPSPQTREKPPVSAPAKTEATTPTKAAKPAEGQKSGDTAAVSGSVTQKQVDAFSEWRKYNPNAKVHSAFLRNDGSVSFGYEDGSGVARSAYIFADGKRSNATPVHISWKDFDEIHGKDAARINESDLNPQNPAKPKPAETKKTEATKPAAPKKGAERKDEASTAKPAAKHRQPSIKMKDEAAAKKAKAALDAINFDTPELDTQDFDPERFGKLVTGVGKLVDVLMESGYKDFKSLATYIYEQDPEKYGRAKPVLQDIWNAVARARGLDRVDDTTAERIFADIEKSAEGSAAPASSGDATAPKPPPANKLQSTRISDAADEIAALILSGKKFTRKDVTDIVERQLGGKVANGDFDAKQVTDIMELAMNRVLNGRYSTSERGKRAFAPDGNASVARLKIQSIRGMLDNLPTQTTRSIEQDKMQQFSTPPTEAFAAAWVANMNGGDVMLEPSAGIGGLAVFGANAGAKVVTNELSPRRAEILGQLGIGKPFEFNAENLYAFLEPDIKAGKVKRPTVVVMNPPFSNSQRTDKKNTHIGADHVEQALKLLAPGGRLVAIVGNGMAHDRPAFKSWWDRIGREYTVRANIGVNGAEYAKYGTTFDNNIIVIDKVEPNGSIAPIYGKISSLDELPAMLEGVRNDRPSITERDSDGEQTATRQGGDGGAVSNGRPAQPDRTRASGTAGGEGSGRGTRAAGQRGGRPASAQSGAETGLGAQNDGASNGGGNGRGGSVAGGRGDSAGLDDGRDTSGRIQPELAGNSDSGLTVENVQQAREVGDGTFSEYKPSKVSVPGMKPHPTALVESSAMASVQPPNPTYSPKIPKKIIEDGVLSEAQIEQVVYAGQAHEQILGNGERKGYFIGDGTGVGKGREISGIILDNFNNGRHKAVWVSKTSGLSNDAKRDLTPFGLAEELFTLESKNLKGLGARGHGVAFTTYSSLAKDHERIDERGNVIASKQGKESRMQALVKWLGRDFDGVIVFDESHLAGNAVPVKGKRGMTKPSAQALAVVDLQRVLPKARILYVSATGATEVNNLAYATRLGLWGKGTAFKDRDAFITQVSNGGISVMEIVARDMKAMGVYMARTLSYEGIENERVTHELSPDQVKQYNLLADTWQMVMGEVESALVSSNGIHGKANGNVKSAFWGAHQRFFNQTLTAMQMPTVLSRARELWESGYSPVFQIVTTNEAAQNRAIQNSKDAGGEVDVENLDLSPRDILIGFVEQSFPTVQYIETSIPGSDKTQWVPLTDAQGNVVHDPAAIERKERLLGRLQRMKMGEAPLDMILNEFGHENVAEVTGRSSRREMVRNSDGEMEMKIVRRTKNNAKQEADEFNAGKRTVLVFSGAGNTGFSFHADRNFKNQRRRVQFMIEAGYNAAAAIQGLGRTHRANESSHPLYELCSTNLPGHKRFMSTIARRLAQLGSLTSGDRASSGSGVFSESDNLENQYARSAVLDIFEEMFHDNPEKFNRICSEMGFMKARINPRTGEREYINTLLDDEGQFDAADKLDIPHFLNRILAMKIDAQNELFDAFSNRMAEIIERAKENGTFDPGMEKLKGETVEVKNRTRLWEDAQKIGATDIVEVGVTKKSRKTDYEAARHRLEISAADGARPTVYLHNGSGEVLMMVETKQTKTMKDGSIVSLYRQIRPNGETGITTETAVGKNYTPLFADGEARWSEAYNAVPELVEQSKFFANGTLLPIWDKLGATNPRFFKVVPTGGAETRAFLGMEIAPENVESVLSRFGKSVGSVEVTPDVQLRRIMKDGKKVELQNGWTLKRVKVLGDNRIEIDGVDEDDEIRRLAEEPYAYAEKVGYLRAFVKPNAESMTQFLAEYPAVPDKGSLATATGASQDLSGDKYKQPLDEIYERMDNAPDAEMFDRAEDEARQFLVRLSNEQLGEVFDDYRSLEPRANAKDSAARSLRRIAMNELRSRHAFGYERYDIAERDAGGNIVNFDTPELFTGSAADYEKPALHYVGTGEGSQVYGWGLYGSTERGVAEGYAKGGRSGESIAWRMFKAEGRTKAIRTMKDGLRKGYYTGNHAKWIPEAIKILEEHREKPPSQHLYEQTWFTNRAPGDESHLLKWYEPVSKEQKQWIADELNKSIDDPKMKWVVTENGLKPNNPYSIESKFKTGQEAYQFATIQAAVLAKSKNGREYPRLASEFLARAGIDGVKYPVDSYGSKGVKDGDEVGWNYVSFRDDNVRVDHKWRDGEMLFDTPELSPAEEEYVSRVDKTPTDKDKREVFGFTKADIDHEFDVLHMKIPKHVVVHDDQVELQADALLANREYMAKLSRAVYRFGRPISAYENVALGKFWKMRAVRVNELQKLYDELAAIPKEDLKESPELAAELKGVAADLANAKAEMFETGVAKKAGMSEVGRSLRSNRFLHYLDNDYSYAGLLQTVADAAGGLDRVPPEMQKEVKDLADRFAELDEEGREIYKAKLKAFSDRVVEQIKNGAKMRRAVERRAGDEAKRVTRNYNEALVQIEIAAKELGDTLIGMADQQYPGWGKWLKWLGEFHCYENPNITEEEVVAKIVEDVRPFVENVDENQVRDALTGYGHSYKMSRYDAQRLMNDLRAQALEKVKQREMREKGTLPLATGPQRDEPSDALRAERKKTYEMKKEIPDEARDAKRLKGLLDSAKTRVKNRIADMERAIETGERIPAKDRTVAEDAELRELRKRRDELQKVYDEMFKTERGMTDAQRIAAAEKAAARELELAMEDLARAQSGDFSKRPKRAAVTSDTLETLRDRVQQVRDSILELKKAKYEFGMTPEEIAALNARKIANRERAMLRQAERIQRGDTLAMKKVQPPMPPEMHKRYDELARQMKKGRQKLADMRLAALNATKPAWRRSLEGYGNFFISAQRALRATLDFSSVLRQAARITLAHPVKGARAFAKAWDAAKSEASLAAVNEEITSDPTIREAVEKFGLHLRETDSENARDVELYYGMERSRVKVFGREFGITDIPWFGELMLKSERHYITYLNSVSAELYSSVVNDRTRFPAGATPWQKKMVADMVNVWNGSAALSNERRQALQKAGVNLLFWAPQLAVSRIQSAVGYSIWHPFAAEGVKNAQGEVDPVSSEERRTLAKIGAAEYVRSTAAMLALGWLLRWLFSDDDDEYYFKEASLPEKLVMLATPKVGNTTIDLSGGEASVYRLVYQLFAQEKRSGKGRLMKFGEYGSPTVMGTLGRFAEGKLAPWASTAVALWTGKDYVGKEFTWTDMATSLVVPLSFEDIKDQFVQNGLGKSLVTAPLTILGAGGSTYDRYPYENAVNRFREDVESFGKSAAAEIDARIKAVAKLERAESDAVKNGEPPNEMRLRRIEEMRADVLRLIRSARR